MNPQQEQKKLDLQKIVEAKQIMLAEKFEEVLNKEKFPMDKLSCNWKGAVRVAITTTAPYHHKLPLNQFADVVVNSYNDELTLFQFGVLSNSLEMVSPDDLGRGDEYGELISEALQHIEWYQERIKEIRKEVELEVEAEFKVKDLLDGKNNLKVAEA